jgi:hypothetical protein
MLFKLAGEEAASYRKLTHAITLAPTRDKKEVTLAYISSENEETFTKGFSQSYDMQYGIRADDDVTTFLLENVNRLNVEVELVNVLEVSGSKRVEHAKYSLNQIPIENQTSGQLTNTGTLSMLADTLVSGGTFDETTLVYAPPAPGSEG